MIKNPCADKFDIIIIAGQSNAAGCGLGESKEPWRLDDKIMMFCGDYKARAVKTEYGNEYLDLEVSEDYYLKQAEERMDENIPRGVFALSFARAYADKYLKPDRKVLLVQTAIGGTGFAKKHWGNGDVLSERMYKMIDAALSMNRENKIVAFLWHQGEHDSFENAGFNDLERFSFYYKSLTSFLNNFRMRYGVIPFVSAGFTKDWTNLYKNQCEAIYSATEKVCSENQKAVFIKNTQDLNSNDAVINNGDNVHFSRDAGRILGKRYFDEFEKLI